MLEFFDRADAVDSAERAGQNLEIFGVFQIGRMPTLAWKDGKTKSLIRQQRGAIERQRCNHWQIELRKFERKLVFLVNFLIAPALGAVEFDDDELAERRSHVKLNLVNAVFVAVQRKQAARGHKTEVLQRIKNQIRTQAFVGSVRMFGHLRLPI